MSDYIEEFRSAMSAAGFKCLGPITADGKIHRYKSDGEKDASAWYILFPPDPLANGVFGCWRTQQDGIKWSQKNGNQYSPQEMSDFKKKWADAERQRAQDEVDRHARISVDSKAEFLKCTPVTNHDYLSTKKVPAFGDLRVNADGDLVLPLTDAAGKLWSYQTIDYFGDKLFRPGGRVKGTFFQIGDFDDGPLIICEGYATGATIHRATKWPVICAMNCGNLKQVAQDLKAAHPERTIVIAADNDRFTQNNPGLTKAHEAAKSIKAVVCIPNFPEAAESGTDFNDLEQVCGEGVVRGQFHALLGVGLGRRVSIRSLLDFDPEEDKTTVLGKRYLCKGGSCVIVAQTSAGKSSLGIQMAICFALGIPFFGLKPRRPLKSVYVQAENDDGDTAEMVKGVILGLGIMRDDDYEGNQAVLDVLEKNLIILRDQTHVGDRFAEYAEKVVELHHPDLFWVDPMLSFYGDDINDQSAMSNFLRAGLNPISERTGIVWMLLHHTGKPAKDASKTQKGWSARDFSYMGIGSSELSNWARAIICLTATSEDEFRMIFAKRGWRAGLMDGHTPVTELSLAYSTDHICWRQIPKPKTEEEMTDPIRAFATTIDRPMKASEIVRLAATHLKRGSRMCWKYWDSGEGELGKYFTPDEKGFYTLRKVAEKTPYKDD